MTYVCLKIILNGSYVIIIFLSGLRKKKIVGVSILDEILKKLTKKFHIPDVGKKEKTLLLLFKV